MRLEGGWPMIISNLTPLLEMGDVVVSQREIHPE
jgi:hypothetical protein